MSGEGPLLRGWRRSPRPRRRRRARRALADDQGRRHAAAAHRRLRAGQRHRGLPLRRRPARHALRRDPALPAPPRPGQEGRPQRRPDCARRARGDHRATPRRPTCAGTTPARSSPGSSTPPAATRARPWRRSPPRRPSRPGTPLRAIRVEYEVLPFVADGEPALSPPTPRRSREGGNRVGRARGLHARRRGEGVRGGRRGRRADLPHRLRDPHADGAARLRRAVGRPDGSRSGKRPRACTRSSSGSRSCSSMPLSSVRVIGHYMGGGFGSKLERRQVPPGGRAAGAADGTPGEALPDPRGDVARASATARRPPCASRPASRRTAR